MHHTLHLVTFYLQSSSSQKDIGGKKKIGLSHLAVSAVVTRFSKQKKITPPQKNGQENQDSTRIFSLLNNKINENGLFQFLSPFIFNDSLNEVSKQCEFEINFYRTFLNSK